MYKKYFLLSLLLFFQLYNSYGVEKEIQYNDDHLVQVLEKYWQWWGNSPEDNPDNDPICSIDINTNISFVFLLDSFETGNTSYDCLENPIPHGYHILFPLITSFCSQGDVGLAGKSFNEIKNCALNLDRGTIKGKVTLDGKEIVNILIDNSNGLDMKKNKNIVNNLPSTQYYKEIFSEDFVNILATNQTTFKNNWENDQYKSHPVYYKGVVHCDCILLDTNELDPGNHTLEYVISAKAEPSSPLLVTDTWDFTSVTSYKLLIK